METATDHLDNGSFYRDFGYRFKKMAFRYTRNDSSAEDLAQEISLKIHQNLSSYRNEIGSLENWAMRLGRNLIIDHYRASKRSCEVSMPENNAPLETYPNPTATDPFKKLLRRETAEILEWAFKRLPMKLCEAVKLRDVEGLTYQEISNQLEVPEGTAKSRINRGRRQLAKFLTPHLTLIQN